MFKSYPKTIILYVCDYDKDEPVFSVATDEAGIPLDIAPDNVGVYKLERVLKYTVEQKLA